MEMLEVASPEMHRCAEPGNPPRSARARALEPHFADQDFPPETPVAHETE
jgi:hypothetical protein